MELRLMAELEERGSEAQHTQATLCISACGGLDFVP